MLFVVGPASCRRTPVSHPLFLARTLSSTAPWHQVGIRWNMVKRVFAALLCCVVSSAASVAVAQGKDEFAIGSTRTLESKVLKQNRKLLIYLPESYERSRGYRLYPVLYMRGGGKFFHSFSGAVQRR